MKKYILKISEGKDLSPAEMGLAFESMMTGRSTPAQIGAFITALKMKGETADEIAGAVKVMRKKSIKVRVPGNKRRHLIDTCGTGGSGTGAFNISTAVAFVLAASGGNVAKHGNRSASSKCGSADVLEKLGVNLSISPHRIEGCISVNNIGFLYAPLFHGAMKYASGPRKEIGLRTIFNIIGPLSNPAGASIQLLGVCEKRLVRLIAEALKKLGCKRAMVVHGADGLDEITITCKTYVSELNKGKIKEYIISPKEFGIKNRSLNSIKGGSIDKNARIIRAILNGEKGPKRDVVIMNASAGLVVAGIADTFRKGVKIAEHAIDSGMAREKLKELVRATNKK